MAGKGKFTADDLDDSSEDDSMGIARVAPPSAPASPFAPAPAASPAAGAVLQPLIAHAGQRRAAQPRGAHGGSRMKHLHAGMFAHRSPFGSPFSPATSRPSPGAAARRAPAADGGSSVDAGAIYNTAMRFPRGGRGGQQLGTARSRTLQEKLAQRLADKSASALAAPLAHSSEMLRQHGGRGGVEVDAAVLSGSGRSFRCSWGPAGLLVCPGVLHKQLLGARPTVTVHRLHVHVGPRIPRPLCIPELECMQKLLAEELLGDLPQHPQQKLLLRQQQHHPQHQQGAGRLLRVDSPRVNGAHLWFYTDSRLPIAWWAKGVAIGGRVAIDLVWRRGGPRAPDAEDETHPLCEDVQYCEDGHNDESEQWEEDPSPMTRDEVDGVRASFSWRIAIPRAWHRRPGDNGAEGWLCSVKCSARGVDGQPRGGETASSPWFRIVERLQLPQGVENNDQGKMLLRCLHSNACSDAGASPPGEASMLFPYSSVWKLLNATHGQEEDVVCSQAGSDSGAAWLPREDPRPLNAVSGKDGEIIARREQLRTWFRHECDRQLDEPPMNSSTDAKFMHVFNLLATGRVEAAALYAARRSRNPRLATILAQPVHGRTQTLIEQQLDLWRRNGHQLNGAPVAPPPPPPPPPPPLPRARALARIHHLRSHCLISPTRAFCVSPVLRRLLGAHL